MRRKTRKALDLTAHHAALALQMLLDDGKIAARASSLRSSAASRWCVICALGWPRSKRMPAGSFELLPQGRKDPPA
jgi:hypothetical protein